MRKLPCLMLIVIVAACALSFLQFPRPAAAMLTGPWIQTYNLAGVPTSTFNLNDAVNITAYADYDYSILAVYPNGTVAEILGQFTGGTTYSVIHYELTSVLGWWTLQVFDIAPAPGHIPPIQFQYGVGYYQVLPFAPLGVIGILGACFAVAGAKLKKRK